MVKMAIGIVISIVIALLGIYIAGIYFTTKDEGSSIELVVVGVIFILAALFSAFFTVKSHRENLAKQKADLDVTMTPGGNGGLLEKNNKLANEYEKTVHARDKLKVLQAAANAEAGK